MYLIPKSLYNVYLQNNSPIKEEMSSTQVRQLNNYDGGNVTICNATKEEAAKCNANQPYENNNNSDTQNISQLSNVPTETTPMQTQTHNENMDKNAHSNVIYNNQVQNASEGMLMRPSNQLRPMYAPTYVSSSSSSSPGYVPPNITQNTYNEKTKYEPDKLETPASVSSLQNGDTLRGEEREMEIDPSPSVSQAHSEAQTDKKKKKNVEQQTDNIHTSNFGSQFKYGHHIDTQTDPISTVNSGIQTNSTSKNVKVQTKANKTKNRSKESQTDFKKMAATQTLDLDSNIASLDAFAQTNPTRKEPKTKQTSQIRSRSRSPLSSSSSSRNVIPAQKALELDRAKAVKQQKALTLKNAKLTIQNKKKLPLTLEDSNVAMGTDETQLPMVTDETPAAITFEETTDEPEAGTSTSNHNMFKTRTYGDKDKWNTVLNTKSVNDKDKSKIPYPEKKAYHYADNSLLTEYSGPSPRVWIPFLSLPKKVGKGTSIRSRKSKQPNKPEKKMSNENSDRDRSDLESNISTASKKSVRSRNVKNLKPLNERNERKRRLEQDAAMEAFNRKLKEPTSKRGRKRGPTKDIRSRSKNADKLI